MSTPPTSEQLHGVKFFIVTRKFVLEGELLKFGAPHAKGPPGVELVQASVNHGFTAAGNLVRGKRAIEVFWFDSRKGFGPSPWVAPITDIRLTEADARSLFLERNGVDAPPTVFILRP